ncbi:hypothetical protein K7432_010890 [Basidiobolus ranarum]|uniref:F-box domain-containing protein n=1 Tax=Basidiobolus ranarum TaxID=34480 RepID=A0ABR2VUT6_9FUNG
MPQPQLSAEIVTLIVSHFAYEIHTLHSLLTVNKLFFKATVPILYKDPFHPFYRHVQARYPEIVYLLLASSNLLPELKEPMIQILDRDFPKRDPPTAPFTVNYLDYYTEIDYSKWGSIYYKYFSYTIRDSSLRVGPMINLLFCKHNGKNIKSITLPILDMKLYLPIVTSLSSLRRIEFRRERDDETIYTNDQNIVTIQDAIEFVKLHVETFDDTLTEMKIPDFTDLDRNDIGSDIHIEDIIHILKRPQVIEVDDSYDFCQRLQDSTTDYLRVFRGSSVCHAGEIRDWDSASLLQRCPKLERASFNLTRPNTFQWAVERRDLLIESGSDLSSTSDVKLPPLQEVSMVSTDCSALPVVQDIAYAFRNTIRNIHVRYDPLTEVDPDLLSWDWLLPNLVRIELSADLSLFDFGSLNFCPLLEELCLFDQREGDGNSAVTEFGPIIRLPKIQIIRLTGEISFKFNFGSLNHSPLLRAAMIRESGLSFPTRPPDSPNSTWTWNWHLQHLSTLDLTEEAAFLFQFRLLDSCPPLTRLSLSIDRHHRSLSLNEIIGANISSPTEYTSETGSRKKPRQRSMFALEGNWELSGETLAAILQRYMSHVTDIRIACKEGLTGMDIIHATQKLAHIYYVRTSLCITDADVERLGMDVKESNSSGVQWGCNGIVDSVRYSMGSVSLSQEHEIYHVYPVE